MFSGIPILAAATEHGESAGTIVRIMHDLGINAPAIIAQMLNFAIVAFVLYRFAIKPVVATIDTRNKKIADGLRFEEEMRARLADAERQHAVVLKQAALEGQRLVEEARAAAKDLLDRESQQAIERAQQIIAKAQETIELDRRKMLGEAREEIARLVGLVAARVLSRELSSEERRRYADAAARELTSV